MDTLDATCQRRAVKHFDPAQMTDASLLIIMAAAVKAWQK